jgi:hypothetical protein
MKHHRAKLWALTSHGKTESYNRHSTCHQCGYLRSLGVKVPRSYENYASVFFTLPSRTRKNIGGNGNCTKKHRQTAGDRGFPMS